MVKPCLTAIEEKSKIEPLLTVRLDKLALITFIYISIVVQKRRNIQWMPTANAR